MSGSGKGKFVERRLLTMDLVQAEATVGTASRRIASAKPANSGVGVIHCLVASAQSARQRLLAQSAKQWGWETTVCSDPTDAQWTVARMCTQLAFVDLEGEQGAGFQSLVRQLADQRQVLLVVCGREQDGAEEIWARQLGVWFYLPGICDANTIGLLCRDARTIVSKRMKASERDLPSAAIT
jgi:ActR/RegA family two-component response regulator